MSHILPVIFGTQGHKAFLCCLRCILISLLGCLLCGVGFLRFNAVSKARELWVDQASQQMKNLDWVEALKWRDLAGRSEEIGRMGEATSQNYTMDENG